ncbi:4Fe-4S single cluster domain-containing protein [Frankia nepalensis]|uniref:Radical SAM protein n=1 Tax=Frankia nepalensis TaxID=1836974 RepID=A0A937RS50_9ACTN|nr:4Fe-4S single cluster domain-containing protein [Frankia nepalensis]MBL7630941.1 radical SAM protein [Frankia nepalensis]
MVSPAGQVPELRVHAVLPRSRANGPGLRTVVWTQGCALGCRGCFNPQTHAAGDAGAAWAVPALAEHVASFGTDGVTISGGEPLEQADAVVELARLCAGHGLSVIVLTGFAMPALRERRPRLVAALAEHVDVLVAGPYVAARRVAAGLRGSDNKTVHVFSGRHTLAELAEVPVAEATVGPDGTVVLTGVDPVAAVQARAGPVGAGVRAGA